LKPVSPETPDRFLEAAQPDRCPLCFLKDYFGMETLRALLEESLNDPAARGDLLKSGGFCPRHAGRALDRGDALGAAVLYEDLLARRVQDLRRSGRPARSAPARECPVCLQEHQVENLYASRFMHWWAGAEGFPAAYLAKGGLCLPHVALILNQRMPSALRESIRKSVLSGAETTLADLREYLKQQNHDRRRGLPEGAAAAWKRAIRLLMGDRG